MVKILVDLDEESDKFVRGYKKKIYVVSQKPLGKSLKISVNYIEVNYKMSKPVEVFTFRDISISVFKNVIKNKKDEAVELRNFKITKVYTDKEGEKQFTDSFTADDLLKVGLAVQEIAKGEIQLKSM